MNRIQAPLMFLFGALWALPGHSQSVVNGDMDGVANYAVFNAVTPPGWTGVGFGGTDLWDGSTTIYSTAWTSSVGGGPFVHGAGTFAGAEWIEQDITGLTVGAVYTIVFEQSVSNGAGSQDTHGYWSVDFGGVVKSSDLMAKPALGVPFGWQNQSLSFLATSATQTLRFTARSLNPPPPSLLRIECGLDTVQIQPGCSLAVPGFQFVRVGAPANPDALLPDPDGGPVVGAVYDPVIDHTAFVPNAVLDLYMLSEFPDNYLVPLVGTVLGSPPFQLEYRTPGDSLALPIPNSCGLVDGRATIQGLSLDPFGNVRLTNALDVVVGSY